MQERLGGERPADFGAEQIHILADLVRVRVFESGSVLAELPGHAGHGDLAHAVAAGCGEAFGDEVADTDESGCGQLSRWSSAPDLVRPPVQKTIVEPPERKCDFTQMRTVWM